MTPKNIVLKAFRIRVIIFETRRHMSMNHSYTAELENLIISTLIPVYEKYQKSQGNLNPLKGINPSLIAEIVSKRKLPALLRPYEN